MYFFNTYLRLLNTLINICMFFALISIKEVLNKYFACIFFVNVFIRNENTKKIQVKKMTK